MFGIFKQKSEREKLEEKYAKLMNESYKLSTVNRTKSDAAYALAHEVLEAINKLQK